MLNKKILISFILLIVVLCSTAVNAKESSAPIKIFITNNIIKDIISNIANQDKVTIRGIKCSGCMHHCYFTNQDIEFLKKADMLIYWNKDQEIYMNKLMSQKWFFDKFSSSNLIGFDSFDGDNNQAYMISNSENIINSAGSIDSSDLVSSSSQDHNNYVNNFISEIQNEYFYLNIQNIITLTNILAVKIPINQEKYLSFIKKLNIIQENISSLNLQDSKIYSEKLSLLQKNNNTLKIDSNNIQKHKCVFIDSHYNKLLKYDNFIIIPEPQIDSDIILYLEQLSEILNKCKNI